MVYQVSPELVEGGVVAPDTHAANNRLRGERAGGLVRLSILSFPVHVLLEVRQAVESKEHVVNDARREPRVVDFLPGFEQQSGLEQPEPPLDSSEQALDVFAN